MCSVKLEETTKPNEDTNPTDGRLGSIDSNGLQSLISKIRHVNNLMQRENYIFSKFLEENSKVVDSDQDHAADCRKQMQSKTPGMKHVVLLSWEEKSYIALSILEYFKRELSNMTNQADGELILYKARLEGIVERSKENKHDWREFERRLLQCVNTQLAGGTDSVNAEDFLHFFTERFKKLEQKIEKINLQNSILRGVERSLRENFRMKNNLNELQLIDVEQLQVQNKQALGVLEKQTMTTNNLKQTLVKSMHDLNYHRRQLKEALEANKQLEVETQKKTRRICRTQNQIVDSRKEIGKEANGLNVLEKLTSEYYVPKVMDYVVTKRKQAELTRQGNCLKRKQKLAQMTFTRQGKRASKLMM